ncbi:serine/threonine-protein kinase [Actinomadura latina]|uniref:Serine/threonine protein kinase n=1 Tax=Actinomadura latina TaxID=163603 RepID=A0A846ZC50_9ACTN|nr:serine/threonine-protein kinase [Actinomadura latina]NKZ08013.1 serine/threonine protein kinase [Actinomadura latina]
MEPLRPGDPQAIGRYRLTGRLGSGGMGEVFLGSSPGGRPVAVKVIRSELAADAQFRARFAREAEAARRVGGFHTAQVVELDLAADPPWLVTAYVPGPSLAAVVAEYGALPERSLRVLGAGLAEALEAIHAAGLVHRDLKPSNILLASDGPRVIDFGIAQALEGTALTVPGGSVGTPGFMAPEHVRGDEAGPPADVFSLGTVLCHAAGVHPFGDGPAQTLMYRIVHEMPDVSELPSGLRDLVAACLMKDPAARPAPTEVLRRLGLSGEVAPIGEWLPAQATRMVDQYQSEMPRPLPRVPARPAPAPYAPAMGVPGMGAPAPAVAPPRTRKTWPLWVGIGALGLAATLVAGLLLASNSGPSGPVGPSSPSAPAAGETPAVQHCSFEGKQVTDPHGRSFDTWSCRTAQQGPLFLEPGGGTTTGYIKSSSNWFVCQTDGAANPEGSGTTWLYTQGDDRYKNDGWGWYPASSVSPTWRDHPIPDIPACTF